MDGPPRQNRDFMARWIGTMVERMLAFVAVAESYRRPM